MRRGMGDKSTLIADVHYSWFQKRKIKCQPHQLSCHMTTKFYQLPMKNGTETRICFSVQKADLQSFIRQLVQHQRHRIEQCISLTCQYNVVRNNSSKSHRFNVCTHRGTSSAECQDTWYFRASTLWTLLSSTQKKLQELFQDSYNAIKRINTMPSPLSQPVALIQQMGRVESCQHRVSIGNHNL